MLGNIISIEGNLVVIKLSIDLTSKVGLLNIHVAFDSNGDTIIGEIVSLSLTEAKIMLLGEISNNNFISGVNKKPSFSANVRIINKNELDLIVGNSYSSHAVNFGRLPLYSGYPLNIDPNKFFSEHFCIVGNSGSGKSSSVARIFQNLFLNNKPKTNIFIFDVFGEYHTALNNVNNISYKSYTTDINDVDNNKNYLVKIPIWLLDADDMALLLEAESYVQIPIIEKMLRIVTIYSMDESEKEKHINDIIARATLEILYSGKPASQLRDQILAIFTTFKTKTLNLETEVRVPGWTRTLKQCLILDKDGKIADIELVSNFFKKFMTTNIELNPANGKLFYTLENLYDALELAFISEGILKSDAIYEKLNVLRVRLKSILNSNYGDYYRVDEYITKEDFVRSLNGNGKYNIVNFNINNITDRQAKVMIKIFSKMLFEYNARLEDRASYPVHIFIEEAHRYIQKDRDIDLIGYNIFEKIAKEGRKYGVILGLITQRPSELSDTTLSQCSNYLILRIINPKDLDYIKNVISNMSDGMIAKIKSLQPGYTLMFGSAFKVPIISKFDMPNPTPYSRNVDISNTWYKNE